MNREKLIDEYGELCRQIDEIKPAIARHKLLGSMLQSWFEEVPAEESVAFAGRYYTLQASPRDNQTKLKDIRKVYKALGAAKFLSLCSITLKAVRESLPDDLYQNLVETNRTGSRTLKTVPKSPAQQAEAA